MRKYEPAGITINSCHAVRATTLDDAVYQTKNNIGCIAAAIILSIVDKNQSAPMKGPRIYTEIMKKAAIKENLL